MHVWPPIGIEEEPVAKILGSERGLFRQRARGPASLISLRGDVIREGLLASVELFASSLKRPRIRSLAAETADGQ
jgi:hypothetical protein